MNLFKKSKTAEGQKKKSGFSLVETMMGSIVMTMVLAGSFSALSQGMQMASQARGEQFADQLLDNEIQYLQTLSWFSFATVNKVYDSDGVLLLEEKQYTHSETEGLFNSRDYFKGDIPLRDMTLKVNSLNEFDGTFKERKLLTLTLEWKDIDGKSMSRDVEFIYSKDGIFDSPVPQF